MQDRQPLGAEPIIDGHGQPLEAVLAVLTDAAVGEDHGLVAEPQDCARAASASALCEATAIVTVVYMSCFRRRSGLANVQRTFSVRVVGSSVPEIQSTFPSNFLFG